MSVLPLCIEPHPALRRPARPVTTFGSELRQFARDLVDTMYAHDGIGLAAPQVGKDLQMFVANPSQRRGGEVVVVNPTLEATTGRAGLIEGCLSVPEVWERVRRAARVRVRGQDEQGASLVVEGNGLLAIVLQHEFDHLEGRLFIDRLPWFRRRRLAARGRLPALPAGRQGRRPDTWDAAQAGLPAAPSSEHSTPTEADAQPDFGPGAAQVGARHAACAS